MSELTPPHGGELLELTLPTDQRERLMAQLGDMPSWDLTGRQICDLELLLVGGFSPLRGFLGRADYERVVSEMRLADGMLWPVPVTLDVPETIAERIGPGEQLALRDPEGVPLAVLDVEDVWVPDRLGEARAVFGTEDERHPGVDELVNRTHPVYVGGRVQGLEPPVHYDFKQRRYTPRELRETFRKLGWRRVIAYHARGPIHRAHHELTMRAAQHAEANLLLHPVVGMQRPDEIDHFTRVRCYEHVLEEYPEQTTLLALLPLASRTAGPREALWHAIMRKNYGCSHLIVGPDHAGPGADSEGDFHYAAEAAQHLMEEYQDELGIEMVAVRERVYVPERGRFLAEDEVAPEESAWKLSEAELRSRLVEDVEIPDWFSYPEVIEELRGSFPPRYRQGFTVFFTGLSGAGKSTIANALRVKLLEQGGRPVTLLDGDVVRKHLSSELGFSKEHRDLNIQRIGFVASEITRNGGIAICAPIAPYRRTRQRVREMVEAGGGMVEVHVATPLEVCEDRDRKGLYAQARAGRITGFTGIDDPYEAPQNPELVLDTTDATPDEAAHRVLLKLEALGYIA